MSSEGKVLEEGREEPSHETPQAITITIMDPSALETTTLDPTLVTSMQAQDTDQGMSTLLVMPREGHRTKDILQTVTETHMGTQELPVISSISNTEEESQQSTIQVMSKSQDDVEGEGILAGVGEAADEEEGDEGDDLGDPLSQHCLICNFEMATNESEKPIPVFKSQTSTTHRKMAVFLGTLVGQKLTSRKAHSDIICRRCFNLLDKVDALEVEIRDTKEEIITKFQETVTAYGGRARRRKPATAKKSDYVFPKVEPEEDILGLEMDENFEPRMEDLLEEEQDHREDRTIQDEEWEPEFKRPKIKREPVEPDPNGPPKRKRGRPRKDASKPKGNDEGLLEGVKEGSLAEAPGDEVLQLLDATPNLRSYLSLSQDSWGRWALACRSCGHTLTSARSVASHRCHYECGHCGAEEGSLAGLKLHLTACAAQRELSGSAQGTLLRCQFCAAALADEQLLKEHRDAHVNDCLKKYAELLREKGLAEVPSAEPQSLPRRGRPRKMTDCTICKLVFASMTDLSFHMKLSHPDELSHVCRLCPERFLYKKQLQLHIVEHFLGSFSCEFCSVHFGKKYPFLRHMEAQHTGDFLLKCEFCEFTTGSFDEYRRHRHEPHQASRGDVDEAVTCEQCGELIPRDEAEEHLEEHRVVQKPVPLPALLSAPRRTGRRRKRGRLSKMQVQRCLDCKLVFSSAAALSRHNYSLHPYKFTNECDMCGHRFKGKRALELHVEGHRSGSCWCPVCKLKFRHRHHVESHFSKAHADVTSIACEYCESHLTSYSKYIYHCQTVHADLLEDRADLTCSECGEKLASRILMNQHLAKEHGLKKLNAPKQECPVCKKFFVHVDVHMNLHTRAIQFPCEDCGEVFFQRSSLLAHHKLRHDPSARAHACKVCGKSFISSALLRTHDEQVHLHKRQFFCEICGKRYKNKSALTYHLKVHRGERPYKCQECGQGFHRPSMLKTHMEGTHHLPYAYLYRKPQRRAGTGLGAPKALGAEPDGREAAPLTSSDLDLGVTKAVVIGDEVGIGGMSVVGDMGMVEGVEAVGMEDVGGVESVDVPMGESQIITVEEGVYIIQVMDDT
ncbi:zinc finger protein 845-like isoform X1 [Penaeus chinensis]|uniref:zinc finger protein 845-like isoform X1 n=1 Tax=Penaeus chinensis TaxID=139456 RepID=UPI001FB58882|nr:zinc finger protein 845-like isoform X1 [Penaeus chinensis]XP_047485366.1 zinc finger protein 845-like isoform X1 [Penaeus chinensis]